MSNYFAGCTTAEQVKIEYRRLCKLWHPGLGEQTPEAIHERTIKMQEINAAYAMHSAKWHGEEMRENARKWNRPEPTQQDYTDAAAVDERIRAAIEKIIRFGFLEIEICGLWVWVSGTQKRGFSKEMDSALDEMMRAGYKWSPNKQKWHFAGVPAGGYRHFDMDEIRRKYGSKVVQHAATAARRDDE
jgi:curved DNA-binding protein CbpA